MSIQIVLVRGSEVIQTKLFDNPSGLPRPESFEPTMKYWVFETLSVGWTNGARTRIKQYRSLTAIFAYFNKLNAHGWMDDDDYDRARRKAEDVKLAVLSQLQKEFPSTSEAILSHLEIL